METNEGPRCIAQEGVWNLVWRRRVVYFLTVFTTIYLAVYPLARTVPRADEYTTRLTPLPDAIRLLGGMLPGVFSPWIDAYFRDPSHFLIVGSLVAFLIWLGSHLGANIQSRMQSVWRPDSTPLRYGKMWQWAFGISCILAALAVSYPLLDCIGLLPAVATEWMDEYVPRWIRIVLLLLLITFLLPESVIHPLRSATWYKETIRFLKLEFTPALIALSLVIIALMFASHFIFNVEEATGLVCRESAAIANLSDDKDLTKKENNFGLGNCLGANIASCRMSAATSKMEPSCTGRRQPVCSEGTATCNSAGLPMCKYGPAVCPAACEEQTVVVDTKSVCKATKVWLEEGQQYTITVVPDSPVWKDGEKLASARGYNISELTDIWDRVIAVLTWPLKRDYSQPTFRVTARVGSTGSNVEFLIPDPISKERTIDKLTADDVRLEETIRPKSSGELFLYVNEAVLPSPWLRNVFYRNNTGSANVTIRRKRL